MRKFLFVFSAILICGIMAGCKNQNSGNQDEASMIEESKMPEHSYEGIYLDEDNNEPNLFITRRDDGKYDVRIGIFRLTNLDYLPKDPAILVSSVNMLQVSSLTL